MDVRSNRKKFYLAVTTFGFASYFTYLIYVNQTFPFHQYNLKPQLSDILTLFEENVKCNATCEFTLMNRDLFNYLSYYLRGTPYPGVANYTNYMIAYLDKKPLESAKSLLPGYEPVINDVTYFRYDSEVECSPEAGNVTTVFVAVNSAGGNLNRRNAIRETWRKTLNQGNDYGVVFVGFAFFVGRSDKNLTSEIQEFGDILQIDMIDTYYNISIKVTGLLNWIDSRCPGVHYVLKADDDVYVNVRNFWNYVSILDRDAVNLYGKLTHGTVQRETKWKMSYEEYPWNAYPNYYTGAAFLISGKAIRPLLAAAQTIPYHPFDDLYYTGFCSERANVTIHNSDQFFIGGYEGETPSTCFVRNAVTWLLGRIEMMKSSHEETELYYKNVTQCVPEGTNVPINGIPEFEIQKLDHLRT